MLSYSYDVRIGPYSWTGDVGDPADFGPVDGLTITRKAADGVLWPPRLEPAELSLQLIVGSADDVAELRIGSPVVVFIDRPVGAPFPLERYDGVVGDLAAAPHPRGLLVTVSVLETVGDLLRNSVVGDTPWPAESVLARVTRVLQLVDPGPVTIANPTGGNPLQPSPMVAARDVDAQNAWDLVQSYLDQWPVDYGYADSSEHYRGRGRMNVTKTLTASGSVEAGWVLRPSWEVPSYYGPLTLRQVGGLWGATYVPSVLATTTLPADQVDYATTYGMTRDEAITRFSVAGDKFPGGALVVTADNGGMPAVAASLDGVELTNPVDAGALAAMYLPDRAGPNWVNDGVTWHLELAAPGVRIPVIGDMWTIVGVPVDQNPNRREWFYGQVSETVYKLENATATVAFKLRRPDFPPPGGGNSVRWSDPQLTGKTWATLNPRDTWDDYKLVRGNTA